jgi:hypothetical protein
MTIICCCSVFVLYHLILHIICLREKKTFCVQWVMVRGDCSLVWWNCWPSLFISWPPRYNWNMVESGDKHYKHSPIRIRRINSFSGLRKWKIFFEERNSTVYHCHCSKYMNMNEKSTMQPPCAWLYRSYELLIK